MKHLFRFISLCVSLLVPALTGAQAVSINTDASSPDSSAILDVKSTEKGMLVPRMSTVQRTLIAKPATGLLVFDTTTGSFWFYNGTTWINLVGGGPVTYIADTDGDTRVHTEKNPDEDRIRFDLGGAERLVIKYNSGGITAIEVPNNAGNVLVGTGAGQSATTGFSNIAIGKDALFNNTSRSNLVAVGDSALFNNGTNATLGYHSTRNTAVGTKTLFSNTTGSSNTALGWKALYTNTTGSLNTAIGEATLYSNTTGYDNVAVGSFALSTNTTGNRNTAIGKNTLFYNSTGYWNTAIGDKSLIVNTTGELNTACGAGALVANTTGNRNSATGWGALVNNIAGQNNTALGFRAGFSNDLNNNCTFIGYEADQAIDSNLTNSTALGNSARIDASDQVRIGNSSVISIGGFQDWTNISDGRFKNRIREDVVGLDFIRRLRPVTYQLDVSGLARYLDESAPEGLGSPKDQIRHTGFIAQEVEFAARQAGCYPFSGVDAPQNPDGLYGLRYAGFTVPLVKAIQEMDAEAEQQREEIAILKAENAALRAQLDAQGAQLQHINAALKSAGIGVEQR